jgi:hypothetical protein
MLDAAEGIKASMGQMLLNPPLTVRLKTNAEHEPRSDNSSLEDIRDLSSSQTILPLLCE